MNSGINENQELFENPVDNYDILSFYKKYDCCLNIDKIERFDISKKDKVCRYCGLSEPDVNFTKKPHVIPELLGKNSYTSNFECDSCNLKFSVYENDLAAFISPFLTLTNIKAKKRVPTFASRKEDKQRATKIFVKDGQREIRLETETDLTIDKENNTGILKIRRQSVNSIYIYKALSRIGIILMDSNDIPLYKEFINWLLDRNDTSYNQIPLLVIRNMITGKYFEKPHAAMYRLKDDNIENCVRPQYMLIIRAANLILQIPYPMYCGLDATKPLELELNPDIALYNKSAFYKIFDLSKTNSKLDEEISFKFTDIE